MLKDSLSPLIADGRLNLQDWIPSTPAASSVSAAQRVATARAPASKPIIYTLYLGTTRGVHPTGIQMRAILEEIRDYIKDIVPPPRTSSPQSSKSMIRPHRATAADMQRLYRFESQTNSPTRNLTAVKVADARQKNILHTTCKYVTTPGDLENIKRLVQVR